MTSIFTKLHDEDRRTNDFVTNLDVSILQVLFVIDETDTLTTSTLGGLYHDSIFVSNTSSSFNRFLYRFGRSLCEGFIGDGSFVGEFSYQWTVVWSTKRSTPWNRRNLRGLSENISSNFITKNTHNRSSGTDKFDSIFS